MSPIDSPVPPSDSPSPAVLDYSRRPPLAARLHGDAGLLLTSAAVMLLLGVAVIVGLIRLLIVTWPDFGVALIAVPVALIALAFWTVALAAARAVTRP